MFCKMCGTELPDQTKFCTECGASLTPVQPAPPAAAEHPITNHPGPAPTQVPARPASPAAAQSSRPAAPRPQNSAPRQTGQQPPKTGAPNAQRSAGPRPAPQNPGARPASNRPAASRPPVPPRQPPKKKRGKVLLIVLMILGILAVALLIGVVGTMVFSFFSKMFMPKDPTGPAADSPSYATTAPKETDPEETDAEEVEEKDANPLSEENPYREYYHADSRFILSDSDSRYYSRADIQDLTDQELAIAAAEISGRHGATINDKDLQEYLDNMSWYEPGSGSASLNDYEKTNLQLIEVVQRELDGSLYRSDNPYISMLGNSAANYLSGSDRRYLGAADVSTLSGDELVLARSEILARHGVIFRDAYLQEYFFCKLWYTPATKESDFSEGSLSDAESCNIALIELYEQIESGIHPSPSNPYLAHYDRSSEYILPEGSTKTLTEWDLAQYSLEELIIARNQIIARHGYSFSDRELLEYFLQCSWYQPSTAPGRTDLVALSTVESTNMNFINAYEKKLKSQPNLANLDTSLSLQADTPYYTIMLPAYWSDHCIQDNDSDPAGSPHSIAFYEKQCHTAIGAGHLFTIAVLPESEDYTYRPSYRFICQFADETGARWNIVAFTPTDVQSLPYASGIYGKMYDSMNDILATLQLKEGYTLV